MGTRLHPESVWYPRRRSRFGTGQLQGAATAWGIYLDFVDDPITIERIGFMLTALGVGTQTGEFGLFSSPLGPFPGGQTLTKIVATSSFDTLVAGTPPLIRRNTTAFAQAVPAGTHLWVVTRFNFGTTNPTICEGVSHTTLGDVLILTGASALTGLSTIDMLQPTMSEVNHGPPGVWATEFA